MKQPNNSGNFMLTLYKKSNDKSTNIVQDNTTN